MVAKRERPLGIAVRDLEAGEYVGEYVGVTFTGLALLEAMALGGQPPSTCIQFDPDKIRPLTEDEMRRWEEGEEW